MGITLDEEEIAHRTKDGGAEVIELKGVAFYRIAMAVSLPCRIGWDGIEQTLRIPMNEKEKADMDKSVDILREFTEQVIG